MSNWAYSYQFQLLDNMSINLKIYRTMTVGIVNFNCNLCNGFFTTLSKQHPTVKKGFGVAGNV